MTSRATRFAAGAALLALAGCTAPQGHLSAPTNPGAIRLVAFDTCADLLASLRSAARAVVGPYGFGITGIRTFAPGVQRADEGYAADGVAAATPINPETATAHSGTNTHEVGVDEPDLVKTDGHRIVTVADGVLRVVDAATRKLTGSLDLGAAVGRSLGPQGINLLLDGDHALALIGGGSGSDDAPRLLLIDLAGSPRVLSRYDTDSVIVDARQVGSVARVVLRSVPRLAFPDLPNANLNERLSANQETVERAPLDSWLPRYRIQSGDTVAQGEVDCRSVSRPASYPATSLLTVLTLDLGADALNAGDPVTMVANGETVYATGSSLYIATDDRWRVAPMPMPMGIVGTPAPRRPVGDQRTELYKFDTTGTGRPRFVAAGTVPGYLINQYALSEWNGDLRAALTTTAPTTTARPAPDAAKGSQPSTESAVRVLRQDGARLVERGSVTGLGKGERIYGVRFDGGTGYVVTFRQTDPLYAVDLRDPSAPRLAGELKINGYSAYLHPAGPGRLIGVGQDATDTGSRTGTQVSLFDVSDLAHPTRLGQYSIRFGSSEAEFDPHAFLYQPSTGLLVVPVRAAAPIVPTPDPGTRPALGAVALTVHDTTLSEIGRVSHPQDGAVPAWQRQQGAQIRRSLIIGTTLWTVSGSGLKASDATTLTDVGWIPFA